jgi:simple sugar transport system permease protein
MELDAIASVVIGGTMLTGGVGNVIGTLFGVLINGTIVSILQFNGTLSSCGRAYRGVDADFWN